MTKQLGDAYFIQGIKSGGTQRERAVRDLIAQYAGYVKTIASKVNLPVEQTTDAYTDAIMVVVDHILTGAFRQESSLSTYLYRICFNKSVDQLRYQASRKIKRTPDLPELEDKSQNLWRLLEIQEGAQHLNQAMADMGDPCYQVLLDWGYWGYNMTEIAQRAGLRDAGHAKKQKYRCLKKLMRIVSPQAQNA